MKLVVVKEEYIKYLQKFSKNVKENKSSTRPYVGVVLKVKNFLYFAPLASPKDKHKKMKDSIDFIKIKDGELGAINLNNMIPVSLKFVDEINLLLYDDKYRELLKNQISWINENGKKIEKKSFKLYRLITEKENTIFHKRCNDFKFLEEKSLEF